DGAVREVERRFDARARLDAAVGGERAPLDLVRERRALAAVEHPRSEQDGREAGRGGARQRERPNDSPSPPLEPRAQDLTAAHLLGGRQLPEALAGQRRQRRRARPKVAVLVAPALALAIARHGGGLRLTLSDRLGDRSSASASTSSARRVEACRRVRFTVASEISMASAISSSVIPSTWRRTSTNRSRVDSRLRRL